MPQGVNDYQCLLKSERHTLIESETFEEINNENGRSRVLPKVIT